MSCSCFVLFFLLYQAEDFKLCPDLLLVWWITNTCLENWKFLIFLNTLYAYEFGVNAWSMQSFPCMLDTTNKVRVTRGEQRRSKLFHVWSDTVQWSAVALWIYQHIKLTHFVSTDTHRAKTRRVSVCRGRCGKRDDIRFMRAKHFECKPVGSLPACVCLCCPVHVNHSLSAAKKWQINFLLIDQSCIHCVFFFSLQTKVIESVLML